MTPIHIHELATQVRTGTIQLLSAAPAEWLTWAPPGTSNHLVWHAGHSIWLQDVLCVEPLSGQSELPPGWSGSFGMNCRPVRETSEWPPRGEILALLESQLNRMHELFDQYADRLARIGPNTQGRWDPTRGVIHGLHDEARHQGEMYLLLKLRRGSV